MMNIHDTELPPLPQGEYRLSPDSRAPTLYDEEAMEAYATAAVEADRKLRRGEPECNHCGGTGDVSGEYPGMACPACAGTGKAPQPAEPSDSLPRHVAQTLATAIYETAQKKGIANGDHSALSVPQCLHLLDCMAQPAEPCASSVSDKTACGSENGDCDSQPADPVKEQP